MTQEELILKIAELEWRIMRMEKKDEMDSEIARVNLSPCSRDYKNQMERDIRNRYREYFTQPKLS